MKQTISIILAVGILAAGTVAHGLATGRWQAKGPKSELVMPEVPLTVGEWRGEALKSGLAGDPHQRNITRRYVHAKSGRAFTMSLTLGPAGLTSQHTPEYCYPSTGYKSVGQTADAMINNAGFRTAVYRKEADSLRIAWAWSADGTWSAPKYPEMKFLRESSLYKLYIVAAATDQPIEDDGELQDFIKSLLATLQSSLFAQGA